MIRNVLVIHNGKLEGVITEEELHNKKFVNKTSQDNIWKSETPTSNMLFNPYIYVVCKDIEYMCKFIALDCVAADVDVSKFGDLLYKVIWE